jgi:hypothetical protein
MEIKEGKHISQFNKGDIITRVKPTYKGDGSLRGDAVRFLGVENNMIYYKYIVSGLFGTKKIYDLTVEDFGDGWDYYVDIKILNNNSLNELP